MTYYAVSAFVNFFVSILLGFFVFYKDSKKKVNQAIFYWCFAVSFWSFFYFLWQIETIEPRALIWTKLLMLGAVWVPIAYLRVVVIFLNMEVRLRYFIWLNYLLSAIFSLLLLTPFMVNHVEPLEGFLFWPKPGIAYAPFLMMFVGLSLYAAFLSFSALKDEKSIQRRAQIKYMLFGIALSIAGGSTNYFLWYDIPIKPYGNILAISFVVCTVYAIVKHHLLNMKVMAAQLLSLGILVVSFLQIITARNTIEILVNVFIFLVLLVFSVALVYSMENELKRKEELQVMADALSSANDELRKLDNAKTEFISIASHQLRTPLTAIKGFLSLVLEGSYGEVNKDVHGALDKTYAATERLIQLVEDLLNVSRIEAGRLEFKFEKASVQELLKELYENFILAANKKKLSLELKEPAKPIADINMDRSKLREVFSNIFDNAIKYTDKGGVTVKAELLTEGQKAAKRTELPSTEKGPEIKGDVVRITVSDTGIGIPAEEMPYLFKKFSRGKDISRLNAGGTGLGIYVGKSIMESHHGRIWVESKGVGMGASFIVELPIS